MGITTIVMLGTVKMMSDKKTINVFFDTEFTSINPNETAHLISIGAVAMDGREVYWELLDTWATHQCSQFVIGTVLVLLDNNVYHKERDVAEGLAAWISELGDDNVVMRSDCPSHDWKFVEAMFNKYDCWPTNLRRSCGVIGWENPNQVHRYNAGLALFWKENAERQHHALVDARSLRFAWAYATRKWGSR